MRCLQRHRKVPAVLFLLIVCSGIFVCGTETVLMVRAQKKTPSQGATVIVLGCRVYGTAPSRMLAQRIDAAYDFLTENPESKAVLSGGQGDNEDISEAECMFRRLTEKGIDENRLFLEDRSTSTYENITFSYQIIQENNLNPVVAIATSDYHMYRAIMIADATGLTAGAVPAKTWGTIFPTAYVREYCAILYQSAVLLLNSIHSSNSVSNSVPAVSSSAVSRSISS